MTRYARRGCQVCCRALPVTITQHDTLGPFLVVRVEGDDAELCPACAEVLAGMPPASPVRLDTATPGV